jgi:Spy/CpxP family protein refolding chaperone
MNTISNRIVAISTVIIFASACSSIAPSASPYAGQEARQIKALSATEVAAYVEGKGQGFAKPAELNAYPGPMHVLELADQLALTAQQKEASKALMVNHKTEVRELGRTFVSAEAALDKLFSSRLVTAEALRSAVEESARIQSRIRSAHLETHLQQTALLTSEQNAAYQRLRGYDSAAHHH